MTRITPLTILHTTCLCGKRCVRSLALSHQTTNKPNKRDLSTASARSRGQPSVCWIAYKKRSKGVSSTREHRTALLRHTVCSPSDSNRSERATSCTGSADDAGTPRPCLSALARRARGRLGLGDELLDDQVHRCRLPIRHALVHGPQRLLIRQVFPLEDDFYLC